jgi:hypothetical protein
MVTFNEVGRTGEEAVDAYFKMLTLHSSYKKKLKIKIYETVILPVVLYGCET